MIVFRRASGDIPGDMFFTRAEFEEFSCQHNLYERLVDKEKELHPNRPALFTVKREQGRLGTGHYNNYRDAGLKMGKSRVRKFMPPPLEIG